MQVRSKALANQTARTERERRRRKMMVDQRAAQAGAEAAHAEAGQLEALLQVEAACQS